MSSISKAAVVGAPLVALGTGYLVQRACKKDGKSCYGTAALAGIEAVVAASLVVGLVMFGPTLYRMATSPQTGGQW